MKSCCKSLSYVQFCVKELLLSFIFLSHRVVTSSYTVLHSLSPICPTVSHMFRHVRVYCLLCFIRPIFIHPIQPSPQPIYTRNNISPQYKLPVLSRYVLMTGFVPLSVPSWPTCPILFLLVQHSNRLNWSEHSSADTHSKLSSPPMFLTTLYKCLSRLMNFILNKKKILFWSIKRAPEGAVLTEDWRRQA